ncbi:MAG: phosphatase PAP2 family protein [Candidatus Aenigmatarchaeota archaeon]
MELLRKIIVILIIYGFFLTFLMIFLNQAIALDNYLFQLIDSIENIYLDILFNSITYLGSSIFWIFLIVLFWLKKEKKLSLSLLFAFFLDTISLVILKNIFLRPRPKAFEIEIGPSFPSGHSERAFSGAVILSSYYKNYKFLFYFLALLTAFSRIYIGFHYPLDVLIGSINGLIIGFVSLEISKLVFKNNFSLNIVKIRNNLRKSFR